MEIINITDTAYGGSGVGRASDGKAIFIPYTVTGDKVAVNIVADKGSYYIGEINEIITSSPWRINPICPHHGICGGCHFGHIKYEYQLEIKRNIVIQALRKHKQAEKIAKLINVISDNPIGYRIRATLRVLNGKIGFFKAGSNDFIPVDSCSVISPSLYAKCVEWATQAKSDAIFSLSAIENERGEAIAEIQADVESFNGEIAPFIGIKYSKRHIGSDYLIFHTNFGEVAAGYGGFFQANKYLNEIFQQRATDDITGKVLELYAGSGFFTAALVHNGAQVNAIEVNPTAAKLGKKLGYPIKEGNVSTMNFVDTDYGTLFLDPPRDGIDKKTLARIIKLQPKKIVYVSCNPMTLARDLNKLNTQYAIDDITIFDMFPNTYHIETVVVLHRL